MINVTKTYLPPFELYVSYLRRVWGRGQITNHGPLVLELEAKLKKYLNVKHLFFVSNGTIALQIAMKALNLKKEIITTPLSYVASTSTIVWEGCRPKFVDIDPQTLCINANQIKASISDETEAVLAVHVYGYPCDVTRIGAIAKRYKLKVIYDAAHAFGVKYGGRSLLEYGDISTLSFHATKLFHTCEGGAVITQDDEIAHRISYLRNFGHNGPEDFWGLGINGKNSELHAAMGLCLLPRIKKFISMRKRICEKYSRLLMDTSLETPKPLEGVDYNYAYYPVIFSSEKVLLRVREKLQSHGIYPRRYFYPSLNNLPYINGSPLPIANRISRRILCLPLYHDLANKDVIRIANIIHDSI